MLYRSFKASSRPFSTRRWHTPSVPMLLASAIAFGCDSPTATDQAADQMEPAALRLDPTDWAAVAVGSTVQLTVAFLDEHGAVIPCPPDEWTISWLSSDETVASVVDGVVTGVALGEAMITATFGDLADEVRVYVEPVPTAEDLLVGVGIHPDTVAPGDPFRVTYTITNTTSLPVILTTACTALARVVRVYRDGESVGFGGFPTGCRPALTYWDIAPWRDWQYSALAEVFYGSATIRLDSGTIPADPGDYTIVIESFVIEINGERAELPTISATMTVSP